MREKLGCTWLQERESRPRSPVLRNQLLYFFQHINGFNFSFSLPAYNLFDGAPIWKLRTCSGMRELEGTFVTVGGDLPFSKRAVYLPSTVAPASRALTWSTQPGPYQP